MKTFYLAILSTGLACVGTLSAATITFTNTNSGFTSYAPIVDSAGQLVPVGTATIAVGFFSNEAAVTSGDFTSFVQFGSFSVMNGAGFGLDGMFNNAASSAILAGSPFIGQNIFTFISFATDALVAKSTVTFAIDSPDFIATIDIANDAGLTFLFGGLPGPSVNLGGGPVASISLAVVPEPSAFAFIAGALGLMAVSLRRRR